MYLVEHRFKLLNIATIWLTKWAENQIFKGNHKKNEY